MAILDHTPRSSTFSANGVRGGGQVRLGIGIRVGYAGGVYRVGYAVVIINKDCAVCVVLMRGAVG